MIIKVIAIGLYIAMCVSCSEKSQTAGNTSRITNTESAESIRAVIIEAFWCATDTTMKENLKIPQSSKLEQFKKEHVAKIHSLEFKAEDSNVQSLIIRITIPEIDNAFYEVTFESEGNKWRSVDARTKIQTNEYNYFSGEFLGKKSLKPYLDKELVRLKAPILE